jgi:acetylornithine deacetylase/succinyl-diaminopimelate desuccinylase-like protein
MPETVGDWVQRNQQPVLAEFRELLAIPNVAADNVNIRRNAVFIQRMLEKRGVKARLLETPGAPPAVFGELTVPGARRTLGFYAHYDGQPVNPSEWRTGDPFKPVLEGDRLYGRSTSDDKAPIVAMMAALDAAPGPHPTSSFCSKAKKRTARRTSALSSASLRAS